MATLSSTYSGVILLQTAVMESIGKFGPNEIDADITNLSTNSQSGIAVAHINKWAVECGVEVNDLAAEVFANLEMGTKWYAVYRYANLDTKQRECTKDDYRFRHFACEEALRFLNESSPCIAKKMMAFLGKPIEDVVDETVNDDLYRTNKTNRWRTTRIGGLDG